MKTCFFFGATNAVSLLTEQGIHRYIQTIPGGCTVNISSGVGVITVAEAIPTEVQNFGRTMLADFFDDWIVYRDLEPLETRLPGLKSAAHRLELSSQSIPRKQEEDYAKVAVWLVKEAQKVRGSSASVDELLFIGDSLYNDGQAYNNMQRLSNWGGSCFIGSEELDREPDVRIDETDGTYCANRWAGLATWVQWMSAQGKRLGEGTAVIVDIDKTALGAKGRNDTVIDQVRLEGIFRTMDIVLGKNFDRDAFAQQYTALNHAKYHCITADNQDYLAYICLVLNANLVQFDELVTEVETSSMDNFEQFARWVDIRLMMNPTNSERLRQVHETVMTNIRMGDPTPFKRFRQQEFITTVERMGSEPDGASIPDLLANEITITNEVCEVAEWLRNRGCLLLCLSDKPRESSYPDVHLSADLPPLHRVYTHSVGVSIRPLLDAL